MGKKSKDGRAKLPKKIAGVKLPKELRKAGNALIETAQSPVARQMLAAGLGLAAAGVRPKAATTEGHAPAPSSSAAPIDPHAIGAALGIVTQQVLGRLFAGTKPEGGAKE